MTPRELRQLTDGILTERDVIHISIPIEPKSCQTDSRVGRSRKGGSQKIWFYTDPDKVKYLNSIKDEISHQLPESPFDGPISVEFDFYIPSPGRLNRRLYRGAIPCWENKTDWDNFCKGTQDAFTKAGLWINDSQIWFGQARKWYCELDLYPRIECTITHYTYHEPENEPSRRIQRAKKSDVSGAKTSDWRDVLPV